MYGEIRIRNVKIKDVIVGFNDTGEAVLKISFASLRGPLTISLKKKLELRRLKKLMEYTDSSEDDFNNLRDKTVKIVIVESHITRDKICGFGDPYLQKFTPTFGRNFKDMLFSELEELIKKL